VNIFVRSIAKKILPLSVYEGVKKNVVHPIRRMSRFRQPLFFSLPYTFFGRYQYPSVLAIFLSTKCNLRCFIWRCEGFIGKDFDFENIYKLKKAIKYAHTIDLTGWGEPFLYPRFEDVLNYIYSVNPRKDLIQITTNGTRLSKRLAKLLSGHLKLLVISINAATASTYNRDMKGGNFENTLLRIRAFLSGLNKSERRKVQLHFVAHTENFREMLDLVVLASNLGISTISIGQYLINIPEHIQFSLLLVKTEYNDVVKKAEDLGARLGVQVFAPLFIRGEKKLSSQSCVSPFTECFILVDGSIGPCCFCGSYRIGNAYETSFEDVWFGRAYRKLRKSRYLLACKKCMPFLSLDEYQVHFTADFKETDEFKKFERNYKNQ
jgi:MoaA/NifB/PqqE/SkfB family radical SAM enzyme